MDNTLAYLDQVFFLSQGALGHGVIVQMTWIYDRDVDSEGLRRFKENLARGHLGRRVEPSPLPFGRHRWIAWPGPAGVEVAPTPRPRSTIPAWLDEQAAVPIDPELRPWRLAVQPVTEGGAAVTLVVSHNIADGVGLLKAVADAVKGVTSDPGFPAAATRTTTEALLEDSREVARALPDMARAVASLSGAARDLSNWGSNSPTAGRSARRRARRAELRRPVHLHSVTVHIDERLWDERAEALGGTATSLLLGIGARLGEALGWADDDGSVTLVMPVSERTGDDDNRGNALTGVRLSVNPKSVTSDLTEVRSGVKRALAALGDEPIAIGGPLPLTPLIPRFVARQVEVKSLRNPIISCSNLGTLDPAVNRPDGTDAEWFAIRGLWNRLNCRGKPVQRAGGILFPLEIGRVNGSVFFCACYANTDPDFAPGGLRGVVERILADFGLTGAVE